MNVLVDILGTGQAATINGQITGRELAGVFYQKSAARSASFPKGAILVDVREMEKGHVFSFHSVIRIDEQTFNPKKLKGEHYMILSLPPQFGRILAIEDIRGY